MSLALPDAALKMKLLVHLSDKEQQSASEMSKLRVVPAFCAPFQN